MSRENVDTVKRSNAALNSGDYDGALDAFHRDVEWRDIMHAPDVPESVRGVSAVRALLQQWLTAFDEFTMEIEEYIDAGDSVVCVTHSHAKGTASGLEIDMHAAEVYEFGDGQIVRVTLGYPDKGAALNAVGLTG
jgi:ketosteroid isomerase-like protein